MLWRLVWFSSSLRTDGRMAGMGASSAHKRACVSEDAGVWPVAQAEALLDVCAYIDFFFFSSLSLFARFARALLSRPVVHVCSSRSSRRLPLGRFCFYSICRCCRRCEGARGSAAAASAPAHVRGWFSEATAALVLHGNTKYRLGLFTSVVLPPLNSSLIRQPVDTRRRS